ncbi:hypothetical protein H6F86_15905 [Phormidium sp. FACHB-592]|uniref:Uncharacterized protein n=1 Tax=Stenomitos frigidus AS-A4 TaxID=2933935 RepID=A0ABV0KKV6_9CYAN|nr:hypothetical protein [Phormidium sp. FACHB-592]MBD2075352.1 hypothetical protein [Phormidium sp. FACHB-592]
MRRSGDVCLLWQLKTELEQLGFPVRLLVKVLLNPSAFSYTYWLNWSVMLP